MFFSPKSGGVDWLLVCLGNPGDQYENTRHNAGFMVADELADRLNVPVQRLKFRALTNTVTLGGRKGKRSYGKGIGVRIDGNDVYCDVALVLKQGFKVKQVALPVQQKIKASIENMLEMNVKEVNVCIVGIQKEKSAQTE